MLHRDLYRGVITWNRTRKRNQWGIHQQRPRPSHDWLELQAPGLRIVPESLWTAARDRMASASAIYFRATAGKMPVRPALGGPSKYLLSNLALCGCCGGPLKVCSRSHGNGRKHFYGCGWYHERGRSVCRNAADVPMEEADLIVLEALLDDVLDKDLIAAATDEAVRLLRDDEAIDRVARLELELEQLRRERATLAAAIASGGQLDGLLEALRTREARRQALDRPAGDSFSAACERLRCGTCARRTDDDRAGLANDTRRRSDARPADRFVTAEGTRDDRAAGRTAALAVDG